MSLLSIDTLGLVDQANSACPRWPTCCWQGIVAGSVTVTNPKAHITTAKLGGEKEVTLDLDVSEEMLREFKKENLIGVPVSGFIILTGEKMVGFVPITREHKKDDTFDKINPQQAIKAYHDDFEKFAMQLGTNAGKP
jgi:hypothetical protein